MVIYHTTFHIDQEILDEVLAFFRHTFVPNAVASGVLHHPALQKVMNDEAGDEDGVSVCVQFRVANRDSLMQWLETTGIVVQKSLLDQFGSRVAGFSTLLEEIPL